MLGHYKGSMASAVYAGPNKLQSKCEQHFRNTTLDHFSWVRTLVGAGRVLPPASSQSTSTL